MIRKRVALALLGIFFISCSLAMETFENYDNNYEDLNISEAIVKSNYQFLIDEIELKESEFSNLSSKNIDFIYDNLLKECKFLKENYRELDICNELEKGRYDGYSNN